MSISGTLRRYGRISVIIGYRSVGGLEPGADCRRSRPLLCSAQLAVESRPYSAVPGDRRPVRVLRSHADHGENFP